MPFPHRFAATTVAPRRRHARRHAGRPVEPLEPRALMAATPLGDEFTVNGTPAGRQELPAVAADAAGNFVVAWQTGFDSGDYDVYARRFDASGTPLGGEFLVHSGTAGRQTSPSVAAIPGGGFVVAWEQDYSLDVATGDIYARRFDAAGNPLGPEFPVNTTADGTQGAPAIAAGSGAYGGFVIAWQSQGQDGSGAGVYARRFDPSGAAAGDEFAVNTLTDGDQAAPAVALDGDGDFAVVWHGASPAGGTDVYLRRFSAAGEPRGEEVVVNASPDGGQRNAAVDAAADGRFVVAWQAAPDGSNVFDVFARRYDAGGAPIGGDLPVNENTDGRQATPSVSVDDSGRFTIAWWNMAGEQISIEARQFGADGSPAGGQFTAGGGGTRMVISPVIAGGDGGDFVLAWQAEGVDGDYEVSARLFGEPDPPPAFSVSDVTVTEGDAGTASATFTVTLGGPGAGAAPASVAYATADGTALAGADYDAASGVLQFAAGETSKTITVTVRGDTLDELDETFRLTLSQPAGATIGDGEAAATVTDDDASPGISVSDASVTFTPAAGTAEAVFTVSLSGPSGLPVTVRYATRDGTATAGQDYTAASGTLTFLPGEVTKTVPVEVRDDGPAATPESFDLMLLDPVNATVADGAGAGTLHSSAPPLIRVVGPLGPIVNWAVPEPDAGETAPADFTVTLSEARPYPVTVDFATRDGADGVAAFATAPGDYAPVAGMLTFEPGQTSKTVTVLVKGDDGDEAAEEGFSLALSAPRNGTIDGDGTAAARIADDDAPPAVFVGDVAVTEGDAGAPDVPATFTITLSAPSGRSVRVVYAFGVLPGTAEREVDYTAKSAFVDFQPGETSKTVTAGVLGDALDEDDETFTLVLSAGGGGTYTLGDDGIATGTILDNDAPPALSVADLTVVEGDEAEGRLVDVTVELAAPSGRTVSVGYATADGTAAAGPDYETATGTLTFAPGERTKVVRLRVLGDAADEEAETVLLRLGDPQHATIADGEGVVTIANDDLPRLSIEGPAGAAPEDSGHATFIVRLDRPAVRTVTVDFATAAGGALPGADFTAAGGTLTFLPGETEKPIQVALLDDALHEAAEAFTVGLSNVANAVLAGAGASGTIGDNDPPPVISVGDVAAAEGDAGTVSATFTLTLSAASGLPVTVDFSTADGTATAGADYEAASGSASFAPGETTKTITVRLIGDTAPEADETVRLNLLAPAGATLARDHAVATIADDEPLAVTGIFVSGSTWTAAFREQLASLGLGSADHGFAIPAAGQLDELPWANIDRITVVYNKPTDVRQDDLTAVGTRGGSYAISGFEESGNAAMWTLGGAVRNDKLLLDLDADAPGGDARVRVNVLPGDVDRSGGRVNALDVLHVRRRIGAVAGTAAESPGGRAYDVFCDVNGSGGITPIDLAIVRSRLHTTLPAGEPALPDSDPASTTDELFGTAPILG